MGHTCRLRSLGLSDDSSLTCIMVFIISLFLSYPHAYCLSCHLLLGKMCINLLAVNTSFENSSHAKVQSPEHRFTCPTSLGVAPLEVTQNLKEKSHIHHDPNPNGPMGHSMASQLSTITKSQ